MHRGLEQQLSQQALPHLREKLAQQFEPTKHQHLQVKQKKRNFLIEMFIATKNWVENSVAFVFTMVFLIPLWIFKIFLKICDFIERGVRFVLWLYVKVIILMINFVYKLLQFFRITTAVNFFKKIVKRYLGNYSSDNVQQVETLSGYELIMNKKQHNLIDVQKVQKKIKTPNIFVSHQGSNRNILVDSYQREEYIERINRQLVPERTVHQNIVSTSQRLNSPHLLNLSQSHSRLKRNSTEPNLLATPRIQMQVSTNRQQTSPVKRMQPDRDISPERYNKQPPQISQSSFKKKQTPEKQILMLHHNPIINGTRTQKQLLQLQLLTLRTKMQDLINQNNREIHELQSWIQQKSQTIMMTRKQNLQLLNKIEQLQRQNIKKNQKFTELQEKIKDMEKILEKEKNIRNGLDSQVQKLEEEIKTKTIQIMSLKQKIKKNFIHLQEMENIFGNERFQQSSEKRIPQNQVQIQDAPVKLEESYHSLKKDLNEIQVFDISNRYLPVPSLEEEKNLSLIKEIDDIPNPKDIAVVQVSHKTQSEIEPSEKLIPEDQIKSLSVKTSPPEQMTEILPVQQKIKQEQQSTAKLVQEVQEFLVEQQQKLQAFIKQPIKLQSFIQAQKQSQIIAKQKQLEQKKQQQKELKEEKQAIQEQQKDNEKEQQNKQAQTSGEKKKKKNKNKKKNR